jgi:hypothetical protein
MFNQQSNPGFTYSKRTWLFFPLLFVAIGLLLGAVVMWLWNAIIPEVTGWKSLTYSQALGLLVLCRILFGGFRGGGRHFGRHKNVRRERWLSLSDEERARFRAQWEERCKRKN